jgi:hypothetical protein
MTATTLESGKISSLSFAIISSNGADHVGMCIAFSNIKRTNLWQMTTFELVLWRCSVRPLLGFGRPQVILRLTKRMGHIVAHWCSSDLASTFWDLHRLRLRLPRLKGSPLQVGFSEVIGRAEIATLDLCARRTAGWREDCSAVWFAYVGLPLNRGLLHLNFGQTTRRTSSTI